MAPATLAEIQLTCDAHPKKQLQRKKSQARLSGTGAPAHPSSLLLETQTGSEQPVSAATRKLEQCAAAAMPYVGVDVVAGHSRCEPSVWTHPTATLHAAVTHACTLHTTPCAARRWPYRAVLSLPVCLMGDACGSRGGVVRVEQHYSTPEAAARGVDAIAMVLLGNEAAINFPCSSYAADELDEAARFLNCISGGAFAACRSDGCSSNVLKEAAALLLLPSLRCPAGAK
jgi:hypothetical protein